MSRFMKEVAEADYSGGFSDEVHSEGWGGSAEHADHRIEFLPAALQVRASDGEVGSIERSSDHEQGAILFVPELVDAIAVLRLGFNEERRGGRNSCAGRVRQWGERPLGENGRTNDHR